MRRFRFSFSWFFFILLALALVLSRLSPSAAQWQNQILHQIFKPILSAGSFVFQKTTDGLAIIFENKNLVRENQRLKMEMAGLQALLAEQSARLSNSITVPLSGHPRSRIQARVIAYSIAPERHTLLINRGEKAGLKKGQAVLGSEGMVGLIWQVTSEDATVLLLTDTGSAMSGEVLPSGARGILRGFKKELELDRRFWMTRLEYLGLQEEVHENDEVVTSGLDGVLPAGIPIGHVEKVEYDAHGLFLSAYVVPKEDLSKLREVLVLLD